MSDLSSIVGAYAYRSRLLPMVIVFAPLTLSIGSWFSGDADWQALAGGTLITVALGALGGQMARDAGKRKESKLFTLWGGKPSVLALSYSKTPIDAVTLKRIHDKLRKRSPNLNLPNSHSEELENLDGAMMAYQSANEALIRDTRDKTTNRLIFEENVNYGFRRNLWGMKPTGVVLSVLATIIAIARFSWEILSGTHFLASNTTSGTASTLALIVSICLLVLWGLRIKPNWVKVAADAYALQLVCAADEREPSDAAS